MSIRHYNYAYHVLSCFVANERLDSTFETELKLCETLSECSMGLSVTISSTEFLFTLNPREKTTRIDLQVFRVNNMQQWQLKTSEAS